MQKLRDSNVWYAIKNIFLAIMFLALSVVIGPTATFVGSIAVIVLGIVTIFQGLNSLGETSLWASAIFVVVGVVMIVLGEKIQELDWFNALSNCLGAGFIAYIGYCQRAKLKDRYGEGTSVEKTLNILPKTIFFPLFIGGLIMVAGNLIGLVATFIELPEVLNTVVAALTDVGMALCTVASICWVIYTILVLKALKERGLTIGDFRRSRSSGSRSGGSARGVAGGASEDKVRAEMNSIANYFTGGFDNPYKGVELKYSVSASVGGGRVEFNLKCQISGSYPQDSEKYVKDCVSSCISKRQKTIMSRAEKRLNEIRPDRDYSISVGIST